MIVKWKISAFILRVIQLLRCLFWRFLSTNAPQGKAKVSQPVQWVGKGNVILHKGVAIGAWPSPFWISGVGYIEARYPTASIQIGENTKISNNFVCIAEYSSIEIGKNVLIGTNVEITDSNFHGVEVDERQKSKAEWCRPVKLCDNVFIGSNVKILKGVVIGEGSIVANGSIVTRDVPTDTIVAGVPARVIREINK